MCEQVNIVKVAIKHISYNTPKLEEKSVCSWSRMSHISKHVYTKSKSNQIIFIDLKIQRIIINTEHDKHN
jgi:hypothetical protein